MYMKLTQTEIKKLQTIQDSYQPELDRLSVMLKKARDNREEWLELSKKYQSVIDSMQTERDGLLDQMQRRRFKKIDQGGTDAILTHAKDQIIPLLEETHAYYMREFATDLKNNDKKYIETVGVGTIKDGALLLNANFAAQGIQKELYLHIEALKNNKEALTELQEAIIDAVRKSKLTDNAEITDTPYTPLRRRPLGDIKDFGLMNDNINAQLLQDGEIFKQDIDGQLKILTRYSVPEGSGAFALIALNYEGNNYELNKKLTAFDKQVCEAVSTRFHYWQQDSPQKPLYITPQEIWRTMNGKSSRDGKTKPSDKQIKRICDSLDKMRFTRFTMDISEEIEAFNLSINDERITGGLIETYVLNSSKVEFTTDKGNTVQGYRISEEPILYTYNKAKKHLLYIPFEMLDTSGYTSDSENVAEFKGYLMQQIQLMKNALEEENKNKKGKENKKGKKGRFFKRSNIILLDTIYKDTGIQRPEERITGKEYKSETIRQREIRRFRQADRQKIEGLLDAWKAKGWIKGYTILNSKNEPLKEKQQAKGYSISV